MLKCIRARLSKRQTFFLLLLVITAPIQVVSYLNIETWAQARGLDRLLLEWEGPILDALVWLWSVLSSDWFFAFVIGGLAASFWGWIGGRFRFFRKKGAQANIPAIQLEELSGVSNIEALKNLIPFVTMGVPGLMNSFSKVTWNEDDAGLANFVIENLEQYRKRYFYNDTANSIILMDAISKFRAAVKYKHEEEDFERMRDSVIEASAAFSLFVQTIIALFKKHQVESTGNQLPQDTEGRTPP